MRSRDHCQVSRWFRSKQKIMLFRKCHIVFICFGFIVLTKAQEVNSPCTVRNTGAKGVCKVDTNCTKAQEDAKRGIQPTICAILYDSVHVVCCEGAEIVNVQANDNSFINVEREEEDRIIYENQYPNAEKLSLSERKCFEYNKNTMENVEVIPLVSNPRPSSILITKCSFDGIALVVGGKPASPGEFPFMAVLGYSGSDDVVQWNCGGTLISDFYVMTAAHCIRTLNGDPVLVRLGELDLSKDSINDNSDHEDFGVSEVKMHPEYHPLTKANDIGLIKLSKKVEFTKFIRPACLWSRHNVKHNSAIATGWGATDNGGGRSDVLQKVSLDIFDKGLCDKTFRNFKNGLPDTVLCAGKLKGGEDTCQGDSGGPLTVTKEDNQCVFYTLGITSFGRMCALPNTPAVYTKVSKFVPWIESIVWA